MNILAIIPARGNSKSIKNKNLIKINGKNLIDYTIESSKKSKKLTRIVVSSESKKILNHCKNKVETITRPKNLSRDSSKTIDVVNHCINHLKKKENYIPDLIVLLQPTSPFRNYKHIDNAINLFLKDKESNSLVSVQEVAHNFEPYSQMTINNKGYLINTLKQKKIKVRRQDKKITYARNGAAIYITNKIFNLKSLLYGNIQPFKMSLLSSIDIDTFEDLILCRLVSKNISKNVN